jgi:hypothetical protein
MNPMDETGSKRDSEILIHAKLDALNGKLDRLITRVEVRLPAVEHFDDRLTSVEGVAKSLTNVSLKLAATKVLTSWVPAAFAGAIAGGAVAWVMLASGIAGAH